MTDSSVPYPILKIDGTSFGGRGVARLDGKVYFVEDCVEGDMVEVEVIKDSDRYADARPVRFIEPSALRGESICPYSSVCGGCQWQGIPYEKQLEWKAGFVTNALQRIGKLSSDVVPKTYPSPQTHYYRNRVLLRARISPKGRFSVGYFRRNSRDFVSVSGCSIACERINLFLSRLRGMQFSKKPATEIKFRFEVQDLPLKTSNERHLLISVYDSDSQEVKAEQIAEFFSKIDAVQWAGPIKTEYTSEFTPFERHMDLTFHTSPGQFQQVNVQHNQTLRQLVKDIVEPLNPDSILDVFCGSGNLSLPLANGLRRIVGVEYSKRAIECARYNCNVNNIQSAEYFPGSAENFLWRAAKQGETYDVVITDPPREGMYKALIPLKKIAPRYIVYISCDPTTLARDLGSLCKSDYKIMDLKVLDFFPNTYHIETLALLKSST